ncbi:MAG: PDZ domain-containing protein, partial [Candidatus Aminicenantaceae bacterium]
ALINSIEPGSPADKAGLKTYDVIIEVEGEPIKDDNDLKFKIAELPPGKRINIKIIRDGKEKIVSTKLGKQDSDDEATIESSSEEGLGFRVRELTESIAHRYNLTTSEGLIIIEIKKGSPADLKGLQVGDIILEINRKRVKTVDDVKSILKKVDSGDPILLLIRRERRGLSEDYLVTLRIS